MPGLRGHRAPLAVISGGSSGIGLEIARGLTARGYCTALMARDELRLDYARAAILRDFPGAAILLLPIDVADPAACAGAIASLHAEHGRIDWLCTSAGMVEPGLFSDLALDSHRRQMEVNYFGTLNLVIPVVKIMRAQGGGRITMISSAVAFAGVAGYSGYAPGKFAVRGLGETLRAELAGAGIAVSVAFPPDTETPQYAAEHALRPEATRRISAGGGVLKADEVARTIIEGAEKGRFMLTPSWLMGAFGLFHSLYAPLFRWQQTRILRKIEAEGGANASRSERASGQ